MIDAFKHFGWHIPLMGPIRWACMYDAMTHDYDCSHCVLKWPSKVKACACLDCNKHEDDKGIYSQYLDAVYYNDWRKAAYFAKYISMLPENSEYLKEN